MNCKSIKIFRLIVYLLFLLFQININGQVICTKYWNDNNNPNKQIDSILLKIPYQLLDTIFCDDYIQKINFDEKWYKDFYNKQFGNFFSNASNVNFNMFWYKQKGDTLLREINIIQFTLDSKEIEKMIPILKEKSLASNFHFHIKSLTLFRYSIIENNIYFICTEPLSANKESDLRFYNDLVKIFQEKK